MSAVRNAPPTMPPARFAGLVRAETHRFLSRRFIRVLMVVALTGFAVVTVLCLLTFQSAGPAQLAQARPDQQEQVQLSNEGRQQCLADPTRPSDLDPRGRAGRRSPPTSSR